MPRSDKLEIIHEDRDILAVNKPAGLLTIATDSEKERTAYFRMMDYVRRGNFRSKHRIFIVHRLDRETSGILLFAKTEEAKYDLQSRWDDTRKTYLAIVHGKMEKHSDTVESYLTENSVHVVYSTPDPAKGKLSRTAYRVVKEAADLAMLEITLITGRKNQIRVHMKDIGHPIAGDKKYGAAKDGHKRLALHARSIEFKHPYSGADMTLVARTPAFFGTLV